jgi:hypothetical protein
VIVKVQVSLYPPGGGTCLIYGDDRVELFHGPTPENVKKLMKGRVKAYFNSMISINMDQRNLVLLSEAPTQDW